VRAHVEGLGRDLQEFDGVESYWSAFDTLLLVEINDHSLLAAAHSSFDCFDDHLVVDFSSLPLEIETFLSRPDSHLDLPEWLRDKLLDFFSLIYTEAKGGCLARPVSNGNFLLGSMVEAASATATTSSKTTSSFRLNGSCGPGAFE
jgi:hypothetical protein